MATFHHPTAGTVTVPDGHPETLRLAAPGSGWTLDTGDAAPFTPTVDDPPALLEQQDQAAELVDTPAPAPAPAPRRRRRAPAPTEES